MFRVGPEKIGDQRKQHPPLKNKILIPEISRGSPVLFLLQIKPDEDAGEDHHDQEDDQPGVHGQTGNKIVPDHVFQGVFPWKNGTVQHHDPDPPRIEA